MVVRLRIPNYSARHTATPGSTALIPYSLRILCVSVLLWFNFPHSARANDPEVKPAAVCIEGVTISVGDLEREVRFFTDVLTFELVSTTTRSGAEFEQIQGLPGASVRTARLRLGEEFVDLNQYQMPAGRPMPPDSRSNDRWFQHIAIIVSNMERAHARLDERRVRHASTMPQRLPDWNQSAAGIQAFYFRDPEGHYLELLEFPAGKGNPKWHRQTDALFLGIDHTALVVADTDASLRFYRDQLGLEIAGSSENYGMEQANLNHIPGAHLRITTLRAPAGPAIELLEYLHPRDGRAYPSDSRPGDRWNWQTSIVVQNSAAPGSLIHRRPPEPHLQELHSSVERRGQFIRRDPDGHALAISGTSP